MNQIIFRKKDWDQLHNYLTIRSDVESGAYAIISTADYDSSTKFLVNQILIPQDSDYVRRTATAVAFSPAFTELAFQQCEVKQRHLFDIHTHPWSEAVEFSSIDSHEALHTKIPYMHMYVPGTRIAFAVFGNSPQNAQTRFWDTSQGMLLGIARIIVI